jgi:putative protease
MAISGKCYLSLHEQNAAANRGACVQNCRRSYIVKDAETNEELLIDNEYIMSPQDLCTISILDQILDAGVDVLKIEGRSKGAEYVDTVTSCYKEAAAAVLNNDYTEEKKTDWLARLRKVYNRGFWEGYYLGRKLGEWTKEPGSKAEEKKIYLGKGTNYYPKIQVGEFLVESGSLAKGDTILVLGPEMGITRETMERLVVNGIEAAIAVKGDKITFPIASKIGSKDKLYKLVKA